MIVSRTQQARSYGDKIADMVARAPEIGVVIYDGRRISYEAELSLGKEFENVASQIGTDAKGNDAVSDRELVRKYVERNGSMGSLPFVQHAAAELAKAYPKSVALNQYQAAELALASTGVGVLPLDPNGIPVIDMDRQPATILPLLPHRVIGLATFRGNFIQTGSVAVGVGTQEAATKTTQDDTYDNTVKTLRGWQAVKVLTDVSQIVAGRPLLNEVTAAAYRALDEYEELQIYTGTGAGVDPWIGLNLTLLSNTFDAATAPFTIDSVRDELVEVIANSPVGDITTDIICGATVGVAFDEAIGTNRQQTSTGGRDPALSGIVTTWRGKNLRISNLLTSTETANNRMLFGINPSTIELVTAEYRAMKPMARTTSQDTYTWDSWGTIYNRYASDASNSDGTEDLVNFFIDNYA